MAFDIISKDLFLSVFSKPHIVISTRTNELDFVHNHVKFLTASIDISFPETSMLSTALFIDKLLNIIAFSTLESKAR